MTRTPSNTFLHCPGCKQSFQLPSPYQHSLDYPCPSCKKALQVMSRTMGGETRLVSPSDEPGGKLSPMAKEGYEILGILGEGGFGKVYKVEDPVLKRTLALKVLRQSKRDHLIRKKRFLREIMITSQLDHPNIMPVYEGGNLDDGTLYFTMGELKGNTFKELLNLQKGKKKSLHGLLQVFLKVCEAVEFAHSKDIIHRDLKPSNIAVGNFGEVIVLDWGLAKYIGEQDSQKGLSELSGAIIQEDISRDDGGIIGTPAYMSPEQAGGGSGVVTPQSDIYSLGSILYHILTEVPPYSGATQKVLTSLLMVPPEPPRIKRPDLSIPRPLEAIALKALQKDVALRYASVSQMSADIRAYLEDGAVSVYEPILREKVGKFLGKHALALLVLVAIVSALAIFNSILSQAKIKAQQSRLALEKNKTQSRKKMYQLAREKARLERERFQAEKEKLAVERKENLERKKRIAFMMRYRKAQTPYLLARDHFAMNMGFSFMRKYVLPNLNKALVIHPEFIEARWELIKIYIYLDQPGKMMGEMTKLSAIIAKYSKKGKGTRLAQIMMRAMFSPSLAAKDKEFVSNFDQYKPDFVPDLYWYPMKAMYFYLLKQYDSALNVLDKFRKKYNIQVWDFFALKAWIFLASGRYKEGLALLEWIIKSYPAIPFPFMMKNYALQKLGRWRELKKNSRLVLSKDPTCYVVWKDMALYCWVQARKAPGGADSQLAYLLARVRYLFHTYNLIKNYGNIQGALNQTLREIQLLLFKTNRGTIPAQKYMTAIYNRAKASKNEELKKEFALLGILPAINQIPSIWKKYFAKPARKMLLQYRVLHPHSIDDRAIRKALLQYKSP